MMSTDAVIAAHAEQHPLTDRLRGRAWIPGVPYSYQCAAWMREAADRIDELERDNARANVELARVGVDNDHLRAQLRASLATEVELAAIVRDTTRAERPEPDQAGPILRPPTAHERADGVAT